MAELEKFEPFVLKWEGGWADHPADRGGKTMMGITLSTWQYYCTKNGKTGTAENLKAITREEWRAVLKNMFWDRIHGDLIVSQSVANIICDWVWASGSYGITGVQRILGVKVDGICGYKTIKAINTRNPKGLFNDIKQARLAYVDKVIKAHPEQAVFRNGWINRINDLAYEE